MPRVRRDGVEIEWDQRGRVTDPAVLLIMGLGAQMIAFREPFCDELAARGHRVIRFDNRDAGLSSSTEGRPPSRRDLAALIAGVRRPAYTLDDMAHDAAAVLDAAGVRRAHVVGVSMGGMIAQVLAIDHPDRVASLTSIMSKTGSPLAGRPATRLLPRLLSPRPADRAAAFRHELERAALIAGPRFDPTDSERYLNEAYERAFQPQGIAFQLGAVLAGADRTEGLRGVAAPTLVIHGAVDPLVTLSGGVATARSVPGATLVVHQEMGHQLARPFWETIIDDITSLVSRCEAHRPSAPNVDAPG